MIKEIFDASRKKEKPDFRLTITVHRHGPRQKGDNLGLLPVHKEEIYNRTYEDYKGVSIDEKSERRSVVSPKIRTKETDLARQSAMSNFGASFAPIETDERLTEGAMEYYASMPPEEKESWFQEYYTKEKSTPGAGSAREVVASFASWILDTIREAEEKGGKQEVDATTHAPAMAAFILNLEDRLNVGIVSDGPQDTKRFGNTFLNEIAFPLMSSFNLTISSDRPDFLNLYIGGKSFNVPISIIKELAQKNVRSQE